MNVKKVITLSAAMLMFASATLNVSAAQISVDKYVDQLKAGKQVDLILDVEAYKAAYSDLAKAFGDDWDAYIEHYLTAGVYEGRSKGVRFDPLAYAEGYADIGVAFGDDILALVDHYVNYGVKENRTTGTAAGYADIAEMESSTGQKVARVESSSAVGGGRSAYAVPGSAATGNAVSGNVALQKVAFQQPAGSQATSTATTTQVIVQQPTEEKAENPFDADNFGHTTSIYTNDESTLLRVEYYDENNKLVYYSSVTNYDSSTNSYTENIYSYDEEKGCEVLEHTNVYVNGELSK